MAQAQPPVLLTQSCEFEPQHGLPERLPADEKLLWQGAPGAWRLAVQAFHFRKIAIYFLAMLAWKFTSDLSDGASALAALRALTWPVVACAVVLGLLGALARVAATTTAYTLTDRRIVMRIGIVLTVSYNLPLTRIEAAALSASADGSGDLALTLESATRIGWVHLWPHARAWQLRRPQPMLRCLDDAAAVSALLAKAWAQANGVPLASLAPPPAMPAARRSAAEVPPRAPSHAFPSGTPGGLAVR